MNSEGWGANSEVCRANNEGLLVIQALCSGPSPGSPKVLSGLMCLSLPFLRRSL